MISRVHFAIFLSFSDFQISTVRDSSYHHKSFTETFCSDWTDVVSLSTSFPIINRAFFIRIISENQQFIIVKMSCTYHLPNDFQIDFHNNSLRKDEIYNLQAFRFSCYFRTITDNIHSFNF